MALRVVLRTPVREALSMGDHPSISVHPSTISGVLHYCQVATRIRSEVLGVIVHRSADAAQHAVQVCGVIGMVKYLDRDKLPGPCGSWRRIPLFLVHCVLRGKKRMAKF